LFILVLLCVKCTTTSIVQVRLAGDNRPPNAGRLEIYYNNTWGTVSKYQFDNREARVVCYMLGFGRSGLSIGWHYTGGSGPVWLHGVYCTGKELSLAECRHSGWGGISRRVIHDVSIICDDNNSCSTNHSGCNIVWNTNVRNGRSSRHQLQYFCGTWKNCSKNLQRVSCTFYDLYVKVLQYPEWSRFKVSELMQRGYNRVVNSIHYFCNNIEPHYEEYRPCYRNLYDALQEGCYYGCTKLESRKYCYARKILENCNRSVADINMFKAVIYGTSVVDPTCRSIAINQVIGNKTDVGEIVDSMPRIKARLAGVNRLPNAGRLEIYYNNTWGTVSRGGFDDRDARVACHMLGFGRSGISIGSYYGGGSGPIWLDYMVCTGNEVSLAECAHLGWGVYEDRRPRGRNYNASIMCDHDNNCSTSHPGCDIVWNTHIYYHKMLQGTLSRYQLQSFCVAWNKCSRNVEREGCTFNALSIKVLQYPRWYRYKLYNITQQRYNEVIEATYFLCGNVERDYEIYLTCYQSRLYESLLEGCDYTQGLGLSTCIWLKSIKYCYA